METFEYALPVGTVLDDKYEIIEILGEGGFGITYKARDIKLDLLVAIKEYLPQEFAARATDTVTVQARTNRTDDYQYGLERFLDEARNLAKFKHPNIVRVASFVECHGTAYFVMEYEEGHELGEWLKTQQGSLSEDAILNIITPILNGLTKVHELGLLHRDIKPANIFLRGDGEPVLIDFGAARQALGEHSKSISAIVSQGYAPPEQYTTRGKQGAFTDLYAIGATLYRLIIGQTPVDASDRSHAIHEGDEDPLIPASIAGKGKVSDWLLQLTDQLLNIVSKQRPQSAQAVLDAIKNKTTSVIDAAATTSMQNTGNKTRVIKDDERFTSAATVKSSSAKNKNGLYAGIAVAAIVVIGAGIFFSQQPSDVTSKSSQGESVATQKPNKPLAQGKAILFVESKPSGAEVFLDNNLLGKTPYQADNLPQGIFELTLKHETSSDLTESLQLTDNLLIKKILILKPATGNYSVFSAPTGAAVLIDGKDTGQKTPASLTGIAAGEHTLRLSKDAYYPKEQSIYIRKNDNLRGDFTLEGGDLVKHKGKWVTSENKASLVAEAKINALEQHRKSVEAKRKAQARIKALEQQRIAEDERKKVLPNLSAKELIKIKDENPSAEQKELFTKYEVAANQGQSDGQGTLGKLFLMGIGVSQDDMLAVKWFRKAAAQGNAVAQTNLGQMYLQGNGVEQSGSEAVRWFRKAAEQDEVAAQTNLGWMYRNGKGVERSDSEALRWYHKAAAQGEATAQANLGLMYFEGTGVKQNDSEAVRWYRRAAAQGLADAQSNLGYMYINGKGVEQSDSEAIRWIRKAAVQGDARAEYNLGTMYETGKGVEQSDSEAVRWYRKAAAQNNAMAEKGLARLE